MSEVSARAFQTAGPLGSRLLVAAALLSIIIPSDARASERMARIPGGSYRPLHAPAGTPARFVAPFALDRTPVTRASYLAFVRRYPQWRRGVIAAALAEPGYLADWPAALDAGRGAELARPVTGVSALAAAAYCAALGKRLPTLDEWEYAASASETRRDGSRDAAYGRRLLALYATRVASRLPAAGSGAPNVYGVRDLHGSVSELTSAAAVPPGHDHAAHDSAAPHGGGCASAAIGAPDPANYPAFLRSAARAGLTPRTTLGSLGFRCAS